MSQETSPSLPDSRPIISKEHLRLLSIAYYIYGAITILYVSIALLYLAGLILIAAMPDSAWTTNRAASAPPRFLFATFAGFVGCFIMVGWAVGGLTLFAGRCIRDRKRLILILVMAGISCLGFPFGTVLGVVTFIVFSRAETKSEFHSRENQATDK